MKHLIISLTVLLFMASARANNPHRAMLALKVYTQPMHRSVQAPTTYTMQANKLPQYQIPKGSIFCRMEDKLTKATGIWIKIGVK